ncbi:MAG: hypothetical protein J5I98_29565, partial [Phaeodactylibacter sp.]|nr:hypothetical protein [Phaeodactylibacter sp.]
MPASEAGCCAFGNVNESTVGARDRDLKWIYAIKPNFDKAFYLKTITLRKSEHFAGYNRGAESGLQRF